MKTKRRLFALICSLLILLFLPSNAYAASIPDAASTAVIPPEDGTTTYVNEFQQLILLKCMSEEKLAARGYSKEDIVAIKEFSLEEALLERAQYSEDQLLGMGYSPEEVQLLKSYNGETITPDNLATYAVLSAELDGWYEDVREWSSMIDIRFHWQWSHSPVFTWTDIIGGGWLAFNSNSIEMVTLANIERCVSHIVYYSASTGEIDHIKNYVVSNTEALNSDMFTLNSVSRTVSAKIPLYHDGAFGLSGYIQLSIIPAVTGNNMAGANFSFAYAHKRLGIDPSISISFTGSSVNVIVTEGEEFNGDHTVLLS